MRRIFQSLNRKQQIDKCGNGVVAFIQAVMSPVRFNDEQDGEGEAADYLTLASLLMRKIERAIVVPYAAKIEPE